MLPSQPEAKARPVTAQCSSTYCWEAVLARPTLFARGTFRRWEAKYPSHKYLALTAATTKNIKFARMDRLQLFCPDHLMKLLSARKNAKVRSLRSTINKLLACSDNVRQKMSPHHV